MVHGGLKYASPVRVTEAVLDDLAELTPLAPLHEPHNVAPMRAIMKAAPQLPQIACFDTAFHRSQSNSAQAFALPRRFADEGVRRYGFHGLYEYRVAPEGACASSRARTNRLLHCLEAVINGDLINSASAWLWTLSAGSAIEFRTDPFQTDTCIGSWHYDINLYNRHGYKTPDQVAHMLVDIVKNGTSTQTFRCPAAACPFEPSRWRSAATGR